MGRGPIYIGGLSYSGKTQLRLMLSCLPDVLITRRTYMWPRFYERFGDLSRDENLRLCLDAMLATPGIRALGPDRRRIEQEFQAGPHSYARLFALFHTHYVESRGKVRWGDQLGHVERYADPIFNADPQAQMIHMVRDPRARYAVVRLSSRRRGKLGWETEQWRYSIELALRNQRRYAGRYRVVRFEDLLTDTERVLREVCSFLDEAYDPTMLPGSEGSSPDKTIWGNHATGAGERAITPRDAAFIENRAVAEMDAFGYEPRHPSLFIRNRLLLNLIDRPINWAGALAWQLSGDGRTARPRRTEARRHAARIQLVK
jgi:hypothetical protein